MINTVFLKVGRKFHFGALVLPHFGFVLKFPVLSSNMESHSGR